MIILKTLAWNIPSPLDIDAAHTATFHEKAWLIIPTYKTAIVQCPIDRIMEWNGLDR